ncbi:spore germination protein [Paenibacillus sp. J23TS9]|uniref:spore germination protein n=1 Tax=Paenibacillus sp. J23TS9 TaxID=2807193 RepID=UPI001B11F2ED|nr:spore germination protein [Paenibacillus sp. J23TS9]GIP27799.1 spore germination protein [Paenibacillus sp. J23TS9]
MNLESNDNKTFKTFLQLLTYSVHHPLLPQIEEAFQNAADFQKVCIGTSDSRQIYLCYLTSIAGSDHLKFQLQPTLDDELQTNLSSYSGKKYSAGDFETCEKAICSGKTILCTMDSCNGIILETGNPQQRGLQQPQTENVIQGPMYSFNENYQTNIALVRQRMQTSRLKIWEVSIGEIANTKIGVLYLDGITDPGLIQYTCDKISQIHTDGIQESGELLRLLNEKTGLFPAAVTTERPDRVSASLLNGKIVIVMDGTPFSIMAPGSFFDFWESAEDQYLTPFIAVFLRTLRFMALMLNLFLPGFYVAITSVNIDISRLEISLAAAAGREGVPYPVWIESMLMLILLDCIVEAGVRLPRSISSTVTMVGGVVLGQAIIQANIVSNLLVIVAATTALTNFIVVDYQMGLVQRILKYFILIGAGILGVLGIVFCFAILVICIARVESFGISYLTPIGPGARVRSRSLGLLGKSHHFSLTNWITFGKGMRK